MSDPTNPLDDALPGRPLSARWVVRGTLALETAMHLGGEAREGVDMPVLRDAREGRPLLPGTTFAGALRNALADRLEGYRSKEPEKVAALFGCERADDEGWQSPLIVFDALGTLPPSQAIEIRDGVAISPATGTAEEHKKYDYEVLPAGTTFAVRVDLLVPEDGDETSLLEDLAAALDAFSEGENAFGARRSRGLGRVRCKWSAERFDLTSADGWLRWVLTDPVEPSDARTVPTGIREALGLGARPANGDARRRVVIELDLEVAGDLLVRSPGADPTAPDVSHLESGGAAVLPGTSLAGVLRAQAGRIAKLVRGTKEEADAWVDRLFGERFEGQRPGAPSTPRASRLWVGEARIEGGRPERQTRVAIDRFTQGAVATALFDEQPLVGGRAAVRLELREHQESELGLVLLVLKDLLEGVLPVGGTSGVGRGHLRGTATVIFHDGGSQPPRAARLEPGREPGGKAAAEIAAAIRAFHEAPAAEGRSDRLPTPTGDAT